MHKNIGLGSLSLLLVILGVLFTVSFGNQGAYGDRLIELIGLSAWSNGNTGVHYTVFYSLPLFVLSGVLGYRYSEDSGAKTGRTVSLIILVFTAIAGLAF